MIEHNVPPDLSLVIPCFQEERILYDGIRRVVEELEQRRWTYELIFVEDHSADRTADLLGGIELDPGELRLEGEKIPVRKLVSLTAIFHARNTGRGGAVTDGFLRGRGRFLGFLDIDLEIGPEYIPAFLEALENGADAATALRSYTVSPRTFHRAVLSRGYSWFRRRMLGIPLRDTEAGYKFFRSEPLFSLLERTVDPGWFWDTEILSLAYLEGKRIEEIPCEFRRRTDKKSTLRIFRDTRRYWKSLLRFRRRLSARRYWLEKGDRFAEHPAGMTRRLLDQRDCWLEVHLDEGSSVIDVGCGDGRLLETVLKRGSRGIGLDVSREMLDLAARRLEPLSVDGRLELRRFDIETESWNGEPADIAVAAGLLDYVADLQTAVERLAGCVKPGGALLVTAPKGPSLFSLVPDRLRDRIWGLPPIVNRFRRRELVRLLRSASLEPVRLDLAMGTMWMAHCIKSMDDPAKEKTRSRQETDSQRSLEQ